MITLNNDNFLLYCAKYYDNPGCFSKKEFKADIDRIKFVKRLFRRYIRKNDVESLRVRLVLNHLITIYNVFGPNATKILFFKLEKELWKCLKPFLLFLHRLPDRVTGASEKDIVTVDIIMDKKIVTELRKI